jgi:hypothetical protein
MLAEALFHGLLSHGPWAIFAAILFVAYYRLVNDVIAVVRANTEANTKNAEVIRQSTQVMIEVKDTIHKCRKA